METSGEKPYSDDELITHNAEYKCGRGLCGRGANARRALAAKKAMPAAVTGLCTTRNRVRCAAGRKKGRCGSAQEWGKFGGADEHRGCGFYPLGHALNLQTANLRRDG